MKIRILEKPEPYEKDAIHVPIIGMFADEPITPGSYVKQGDDSESVVMCRDKAEAIGIANPFNGPIKHGDQFWVLAMPETVTKLTHQWESDVFNKDDDPCRGCW